MDLSKIKLGVSPLTGNMSIYQYGEDPNESLDKRDAERDVFACVVENKLYSVSIGVLKLYEIPVKPTTKPKEGSDVD